MIRTTQEELGEAYRRASRVIMEMEPVTPRIMGALWREHFGLHHRVREYYIKPWQPWKKETAFWIEFPNDCDYTAFMLKFS